MIMTIIIVQCCHIVLSWLSFILPSHRPTVLTVFAGGVVRVFHRAGRGTPFPHKAGRPSLVFLSRLGPDLVMGS